MSHTPPPHGHGESPRLGGTAPDPFDPFDELFDAPRGESREGTQPPSDRAPGERVPLPASTQSTTQPQSRREARLAARAAQVANVAQADAESVPPNAESPFAWKLDGQPPRDQGRPPREKRKKRSFKGLWVTLIIVAILAGLGGTAYGIFQPQVAKLVASFEPNDYTGSGTGSVVITIKSGDIGSDVATTLQKAGVTKTFTAFYSLLLAQNPAPVFQPGAYQLATKMSAKSALARLEDPASRVSAKAVIPEGTAEAGVLSILATATKIPLAELQAAAANPAAYGVPAEAKTLEGFLFPATYQFTPGTSAQVVIKTLVDRSFQALDAAGVAPADRWNTVVLASLVQREAGLAADYPKVSRVFLNRLAIGMLLQSDATVAYGTGHTNVVTTTNAERADPSNPYNTYVHPGLPPGPISNPGDLAINAALHPADGTWLYFVTVNLKTGETVFSTTLAEHNAAVAQWQQWMKDNPGYGG